MVKAYIWWHLFQSLKHGICPWSYISGHLWAMVAGQHMFFDVLLIAVKNCTWQEETEASSVPTSTDALSGWDSTCRQRGGEHFTWSNIFWMICGCFGNIFGHFISLPGRVLNKIMVEKMNVNWLHADTLNHGVIEVLYMWKSAIILFDDALKTWLHLWQDASELLCFQFVFNKAHYQKHRFSFFFMFVILLNNVLICYTLWAFIGVQMCFILGTQVHILQASGFVYILIKSVSVSPR